MASAVILRPFARSIAPVSLFNRALLDRSARRYAASTVSYKPASQTFQHAALNIKEESGHIAEDVAKVIAGANGSDSRSFVGITKSIASDVPKSAMVFGLAGTLPYVGASLSTVLLAKQAGIAAAAGATGGLDPGVAINILDQAMNFQVTYGAVMLSFLGALHWGMEFSAFGGQQGYKRLLLGAVPVVFAWPTLMLEPTFALVAQWIGFAGLWYADSKATTVGWAPHWFSQYRFYLTLVVGTCILGSLFGTSYYGPVAGHGLLSHDLEITRETRRQLIGEKEGTVKGPVEAIVYSNEEDGDGFIHLKKKDMESK